VLVSSEGYLRPESEVLGDDSLIPTENQIRPPPNQFTHRLVDAQPFYFGSEASSSSAPDGEFEAGTNVVLLRHDGGTRCRVADGRGLYVEVSHRSLAELERSQKA
jgi:hypothetical protein